MADGAQIASQIVISGRVDNSFGQLGNALSALGSQVDAISQKVINFGKESVKTYAGYEDNMLAAEGALATQYGQDTARLKNVMTELNDAASQWAQTTIFHTDDVSNAINVAAHAGWDLEEIMNGIPAAMRIAQAGSMDLSEGLDDVIKVMNATKTPFSDVMKLTDQWAYAANASATDIDELGQAMLKMGATMQFADSNAELMAMLGILANAGTVGDSAGTLLRNSMIRLIAPTKKAGDAMQELGFSAEDVDEALGEVTGDSEAAMKQLNDVGFSVYKDSGELKDFTAIWKDLSRAMKEVGGEEWWNNESALQILSAIFPTRTITGGIALIREAEGEYVDLLEGIQNASEGYGDYLSEKMMSGTTGNLEILASKWEEVQRKFGEAFAGDLEKGTDMLGGLLDKINSLDEGATAGLIGLLESLAAAGPALLTVGGGLKLVGNFLYTAKMTKDVFGEKGLGKLFSAAAVGKYAAIALGLAGIANILREIDNVAYQNHFGDLGLDMEEMSGHFTALNRAFQDEYSTVIGYNKLVDEAVENYTTAAGELKSGLFTKAITGEKLTEQDKQNFYSMGDELGKQLKKGIENNYSGMMETVTKAFGGTKDKDLWAGVIATLNYGFEAAESEAERLGKELREAIDRAFEDNVISMNELDDITNYINQLSDLMDENAGPEAYAKKQALIRKATGLGIENTGEVVDEYKQILRDETETMLYNQDLVIAKYRQSLEKARKDGKVLEDENGVQYEITDEYINAKIAEMQRYFQEERDRRTANTELELFNLFEAIIKDSDLEDDFEALQAFADEVERSGGQISESARSEFLRSVNLGHLFRYLSQWTESLGGEEDIARMAEYFSGTGDAATAKKFRDMLTFLELLNGGNVMEAGTQTEAGYDQMVNAAENAATAQDLFDEMSAIVRGQTGANGMTLDDIIADYLQMKGAGAAYDFQAMFDNDMYRDMYSRMGTVAKRAGYSSIPEWIDALAEEWAALEEWEKTPEKPRTKIEREPDISDADEAIEKYYGTARKIQPSDIGLAMAMEKYGLVKPLPIQDLSGYDQGTAELLKSGKATIVVEYEEDGLLITDMREGVDVPVHYYIPEDDDDIWDLTENGTSLPVTVDPDIRPIEEALADGFETTVRLNPKLTSGNGAAVIGTNGRGTITLYGEGGRATEPSIFGEKPGIAEWAIPEKHDENTKGLIDAVRQASGFTWEELSGISGGGPVEDNRETTMIYSPTIYAEGGDAAGIEEVLKRDKILFERFMREREEKREMEAFA